MPSHIVSAMLVVVVCSCQRRLDARCRSQSRTRRTHRTRRTESDQSNLCRQRNCSEVQRIINPTRGTLRHVRSSCDNCGMPPKISRDMQRSDPKLLLMVLCCRVVFIFTSSEARKAAAIRAYHEWLPTHPDFDLNNATAVRSSDD